MKIFTMVKGENDIVEDWVNYHGTIFGYNNIYVIDNYSKDGTYETLIKLKNKYNINVTRFPDYKKKGEYMTFLLRYFGKNEIVFPIDIDEFIVYYDKSSNTIDCDKERILNYISKLPKLPYYKMNYIMSKVLNSQGYSRAAIESHNGYYSDYGSHAKTFFNSQIFKGVIDHGNHYTKDRYFLTTLCLVHFHERNLDQIKKKVYNNIKGLGYNPFNLNVLKILQEKGKNVNGYHHINKQIKILENNFSLNVNTPETSDISLLPLNNMIINLKT